MSDYIKSPLNYVGGKYKLLNDIIPLFPSKIGTFIDVFAGGFNVGINVKANKIIYNDIEYYLVGLMEHIKQTGTEQLLYEIDNIISKFGLRKDESEGFLKLRDVYNAGDNTPMMFYTMVCYAFNYQIRFNGSGKYNMPSGKNRSSFNPALRKKFILFADALHEKDCTFESKQFYDLNFSELTESDFVYCDPPYFNSVAAYNENGGWSEKEEAKLLDILDGLNDAGIKFALSNNLKYNNPILEKWRTKYFTNYINGDYSNCNYHKRDRSGDKEVLIKNYK